MRALLLLLLTACGSTPPRAAPRIGQLPSATCTVSGKRLANHAFPLRFRDTPIAIVETEETLAVTLAADASRATAKIETASHIYYGDVRLEDVRISIAKPVERGSMAVSEATLERIANDTAHVRPVKDPRVQAAAPASFDVSCRDLVFQDDPTHASPQLGRPLVVSEPVRLFDAPGGTAIATLASADSPCHAGPMVAVEAAASGTFRQLRVATEFGSVLGWADSPVFEPDYYGVAICGATSGLPQYFRDDARACEHQVPLFVEDGGAVVEVGAVKPGGRIELVRRTADRAEVVGQVAGKLTPFVRLSDIASCRKP